jgi:hypothetical protein
MRRLHRGWLTSVAVVALLAASGCTAGKPTALTGTGSCSRSLAPTTTRSSTATFDRVSLEVPKGWYSVPVCFRRGIGRSPLGYLTAQQPKAECRTEPQHPSATSCGAPVDRLGDHDVLVVISTTSTADVTPISVNTTIGGRPAQLQRAAATDGIAGATYAVKATVRIDRADVIVVTAYLATDSARQRATIVHMLRTAKYRT